MPKPSWRPPRPTNCGSSPCSHPLRPAPAAPGQAAYASANAALDSIAAREAVAAATTAWSGVRLGSVGRRHGRRDAQEPLHRGRRRVIPIGEGAEFFARHALGRASATAVVVAARQHHRSCGRPPWPGTSPWRRRRCSPTIRCAATSSSRWCSFSMPYCVQCVVSQRGRPVIRDFRVLSGVTFPAGEQHALTIEVVADGAAYAVSIRDAGGRTRFSARGRIGSATDLPVSVSAAGDRAWPFGVADAYAGPLFHGPAFQVIDQLTAFGAAGGSALLKVKGEAGWTGGAWSTDPAALDGACNWAFCGPRRRGMPLVLPSAWGVRCSPRRSPLKVKMQCRLAAFPLGDKRVDYDIVFETTDGAPIASLEGVEFYVAGNADGATA